jgi:hypothetical protein
VSDLSAISSRSETIGAEPSGLDALLWLAAAGSRDVRAMAAGHDELIVESAEEWGQVKSC